MDITTVSNRLKNKSETNNGESSRNAWIMRSEKNMFESRCQVAHKRFMFVVLSSQKIFCTKKHTVPGTLNNQFFDGCLVKQSFPI